MRHPHPAAVRLLLAAALAALPAAAAAQPVVRLPAADRALAGSPAPVFTLGADAALSDAAAVAFDARDNLYVLERGNSRVSVFDARGRPLRRMGRRGRGAGELLAPMQMVVTANGEVVVSDLGTRSFAVFGEDGAFRRSVPFATEHGLPGIQVQAGAREGVVSMARPVGPGAGDAAIALVAHPTTAGGRATRLFQAAMGEPGGGDGPSAPGGARALSGPVAFAPRFLWGVLPDGGAAVSHGTGYSVRVAGPGGGVARVLERPFTPRRVTDADRAAAREEQRQLLGEGGGGVMIMANGGVSQRAPASFVEQQLAGLRFGDVVPVIEGLSTDRAGRIWVQRAGPRVGAAGPIDLLSPDGRYLGTVSGQKLPDAFSPTGRAAWVEKDAAGRPVVSVRALPAAWR